MKLPTQLHLRVGLQATLMGATCSTPVERILPPDLFRRLFYTGDRYFFFFSKSRYNTVMNSALQKVAPSQKTVARVKRYWMTIAFVLGFVVDNLTLNRVDQVFDNLILATYVILAMASMLLLYATAAEKLPEKYNLLGRKYAPLAMQYSFGGLLSGMLIFYGRSGAWAASWPFMLVIVAAILGNEMVHKRSTRLLYNLTILFIGMFSYIVLVIPVLTGFMGPWVFVGSGLLAVFIMYGFMRILYRIIPRFLDLHMKAVIFSLGAIFAGFNFLYFANVIPPIPLSLKEVGIYHSVVRFESGDYQVKYEEGKWWQFFKNSDRVFHPENGGDVFCFTRVFAPTKLTTDIVHRWYLKDSETGEWEEQFEVAYPIVGGSGEGYRGYTLMNNFQDGKWRCSVETKRGQVLGREVFYIDSTEAPAPLVTETR